LSISPFICRSFSLAIVFEDAEFNNPPGSIVFKLIIKVLYAKLVAEKMLEEFYMPLWMKFDKSQGEELITFKKYSLKISWESIILSK
jgi:hypothetical protein